MLQWVGGGERAGEPEINRNVGRRWDGGLGLAVNFHSPSHDSHAHCGLSSQQTTTKTLAQRQGVLYRLQVEEEIVKDELWSTGECGLAIQSPAGRMPQLQTSWAIVVRLQVSNRIRRIVLLFPNVGGSVSRGG